MEKSFARSLFGQCLYLRISEESFVIIRSLDVPAKPQGRRQNYSSLFATIVFNGDRWQGTFLTSSGFDRTRLIRIRWQITDGNTFWIRLTSSLLIRSLTNSICFAENSIWSTFQCYLYWEFYEFQESIQSLELESASEISYIRLHSTNRVNPTNVCARDFGAQLETLNLLGEQSREYEYLVKYKPLLIRLPIFFLGNTKHFMPEWLFEFVLRGEVEAYSRETTKATTIYSNKRIKYYGGIENTKAEVFRSSEHDPSYSRFLAFHLPVPLLISIGNASEKFPDHSLEYSQTR